MYYSKPPSDFYAHLKEFAELHIKSVEGHYNSIPHVFEYHDGCFVIYHPYLKELSFRTEAQELPPELHKEPNIEGSIVLSVEEVSNSSLRTLYHGMIEILTIHLLWLLEPEHSVLIPKDLFVPYEAIIKAKNEAN